MRDHLQNTGTVVPVHAQESSLCNIKNRNPDPSSLKKNINMLF